MRRNSKEIIEIRRKIENLNSRMFNYRKLYLECDTKIIALKHKIMEIRTNET